MSHSSTNLFSPVLAIFQSENLGASVLSFFKQLILPVIGILVFLLVWDIGAKNIHTSLGTFPGPVQVYEQTLGLIDEHQAERKKEVAFLRASGKT